MSHLSVSSISLTLISGLSPPSQSLLHLSSKISKLHNLIVVEIEVSYVWTLETLLQDSAQIGLQMMCVLLLLMTTDDVCIVVTNVTVLKSSVFVRLGRYFVDSA